MFTLADANVGKYGKIYDSIIDEMQHSPLLAAMKWDGDRGPNAGSTLTYTYMRRKTRATAAAREIGSEFEHQESKREAVNVQLSILGGSFEIDRVIALASGKIDEITDQMREKIQAVHDQFANLMINGSIGGANKFDGLKTLLAGQPTEIDGSGLDISGEMTDILAKKLVSLLNQARGQMDGQPTMILCGRDMKIKLMDAARLCGYYTRSENAFGEPVDTFGGSPIVFAGEVATGVGDTTAEVIPTTMKKTAIYLIRIAEDGVHGISLDGENFVRAYFPDLTKPGAVKKGEVEFPCAVALKSRRAAAVIKDITIEAEV